MSHPAAGANSESAPLPDYTREKRRCLIVVLVLACVSGILEQNERDHLILDIVIILTQLASVVFWCQYDAQERDYTIRRPLLVLMILAAVIGVPVYLLLTRGIRGFASIGLALLFFGLVLGLELVMSNLLSILRGEPG
jgi:hypothetical protein